MITVEKGNFKIVVTEKTFKEQLKPLGYRIASKENKGATDEVAPFVEKEDKIQENEVIEQDKIQENEVIEQDKILDEEFGFKKGKKGNK